MSRDADQFKQLRQLMALKRHEQPPPGYFNGFSDKVIARIKAGEAQPKWYDRVPWIQRLMASMESTPMTAGLVGAAACALVISGLLYSEGLDAEPTAANSLTSSLTTLSAVAPVVGEDAAETAIVVATTNTTDPSLNSLFEMYPTTLQPQVLPVNHSFILGTPNQ